MTNELAATNRRTTAPRRRRNGAGLDELDSERAALVADSGTQKVDGGTRWT